MHAHQYALHPALPIPLPSTTLKFFLLHSCHKHAFRLDYFTTLLTCSAYSLNAYQHTPVQNFIQVKSGGKWVILWVAARCSCWARDQTLSTGSLDSETVSQGFFYQISQGSWPLPCLLISELTIVRALQPVNASPEWKQPTVSEMEPIKRQRSLIYPICVKKERNGQAGANQGFSTASQGSCHVHGTPYWNLPTPPIPPFLLVQNLPSKQIVPSDKMWSKLHDDYSRHQD